MILQVHDELNFSVPEAEKEIIQKIVIRRRMETGHIAMLVPLKADFGWGKNWLESALIRSITLFNLQSEKQQKQSL